MGHMRGQVRQRPRQEVGIEKKVRKILDVSPSEDERRIAVLLAAIEDIGGRDLTRGVNRSEFTSTPATR